VGSHDSTMLEKTNISPVWPQCDDSLTLRTTPRNVRK
jgi:hypothetical protein